MSVWGPIPRGAGIIAVMGRLAAPILVTGSHRSGTTWVGKMLARARGMSYVHEPFNPQRAPGWLGRRLPYTYLYVCRENEGAFGPLIDRVVDLRYPVLEDLPRLRSLRRLAELSVEWPRSLAGRARRARPLLKDPFALFSAEWLADRFGAHMVVMVRHPAGFAGSLKRLSWGFDFRNWAGQPLLLRDLLGPYQREIEAYAAHQPDLVDQAVLLWNVVHHVILGFRERHPEWTFLVYEELAEAPVEGFRSLFQGLGLPWADRVRAEVERFSSPRNRKEVPTWLHRTVKRDSRAASRTWLHRLTEEELGRIRRGTAGVARHFYGDGAWGRAETGTSGSPS